MKLRQHDKLKETLKSDSNWEDYYKEIKPLLGLRELGFTRIFEYLNNIKDPVIVAVSYTHLTLPTNSSV